MALQDSAGDRHEAQVRGTLTFWMLIVSSVLKSLKSFASS